jgi:hypothetical protein
MQRRQFLTASALGAVSLAAPSLARAQTANLEWTAGALGGGWYSQATGLANMITEFNSGIRIRVVPGGGVDNPRRLQQGLQQIGFGLDFLAKAAANGDEPYNGVKHDKLRAIGTGLSPTPYHFIRAEGHNLGLKDAVTSRGLRVGTPTRASSEELTFQRVLAFYGTSYDKIRAEGGRIINASYTDLVNAFKDNQIDYIFLALGLPGAAVREIEQSGRRSTLSPFPEDVVRHLQRTYGYSVSSIPAATYPRMQTQDMFALSMDTIMLVTSDLNADVAQAITRTLIQQRARFPQIHASLVFNPQTAWKDLAVPIHPGAERAYREAGAMT